MKLHIHEMLEWPSVRALTFSLNIVFSETTYQILMKFHRDVLPWSSSEFLERI